MPIEKGDHVYIGEGKVHWVVASVFMSYKEIIVGRDGKGETSRWNNRLVPVANLRSGMTGKIKRNVALGRLRIHTKGSSIMTAREQLAKAQVVGEMIANQIVKCGEDATLSVQYGSGEFAVEVRVLEVTGWQEPQSQDRSAGVEE